MGYYLVIDSRFMRALCVGFAYFAAPVVAAESATTSPYQFEVLTKCPAKAPSGEDFVLFDGKTNLLAGWSHAAKTPDFAALTYSPEAYRVDASAWVASQECMGEKVFQTILVKKLGTWQGSHTNGIEPLFDRANIRFEDVESVVLELKLIGEKTRLVDRKAYYQHYEAVATPEQLDTIDRQQYNFGITLFGGNFQDQSIATLNSQTLITFDPKTQQDQWLRVTLPVAAMHSYLEQHYSPTPVSLAQHAAQQVMGLRINPETASGKVVRHVNGKPWEEAKAPPELFKEMAIQLRRVALVLKTSAAEDTRGLQ